LPRKKKAIPHYTATSESYGSSPSSTRRTSPPLSPRQYGQPRHAPILFLQGTRSRFAVVPPLRGAPCGAPFPLYLFPSFLKATAPRFLPAPIVRRGLTDGKGAPPLRGRKGYPPLSRLTERKNPLRSAKVLFLPKCRRVRKGASYPIGDRRPGLQPTTPLFLIGGRRSTFLFYDRSRSPPPPPLSSSAP